ncbi:hypothetical protein F4811DRAFT_557340 [Daldinia bambusicola]|nr:hypothetical protein F4811DRAFT_557340 [Daldinia bambusicola]
MAQSSRLFSITPKSATTRRAQTQDTGTSPTIPFIARANYKDATVSAQEFSVHIQSINQVNFNYGVPASEGEKAPYAGPATQPGQSQPAGPPVPPHRIFPQRPTTNTPVNTPVNPPVDPPVKPVTPPNRGLPQTRPISQTGLLPPSKVPSQPGTTGTQTPVTPKTGIIPPSTQPPQTPVKPPSRQGRKLEDEPSPTPVRPSNLLFPRVYPPPPSTVTPRALRNSFSANSDAWSWSQSKQQTVLPPNTPTKNPVGTRSGSPVWERAPSQ